MSDEWKERETGDKVGSGRALASRVVAVMLAFTDPHGANI
jgi:hypothetical protein